MKVYPARKTPVKADLLNQLIKAKKLMDEDPSRKVDITMLAKEASLSKFHFFRCFKNAFGLPPYQYLIKKRLERSMELLLEGNCQVKEIAYQVGFNDIYSFSKSFKKHFNACPSRISVLAAVAFNGILFCGSLF